MTVNWKYIKYLNIIAICLAMVGCKESDYTQMVKSELAKGIRKDSVLLGISLGDSRDEFYGRCFDLNKEQIVTAGTGVSVQYIFDDSTVHREPTQIKLLFYPEFDSTNVISTMNLEFSYTGWAPWNRGLQSDSLQLKLVDLLSKWYGGNKFVNAHVQDKEIPVKVDGNRRILVDIEDSQRVLVRVHDILHPRYRHSLSEGKDSEGKDVEGN
jgi:hypothetical protein